MFASELPKALWAKLNSGNDAPTQSQLIAFLSRQRWYRRCGGMPKRVVVQAAAAVSGTVFWCLACVSEHDGTQTTYQLPLCICTPAEVAHDALVIHQAPELQGAVLADATQHEGARAKMLAALISRRRMPAEDGFWQARTCGDVQQLLGLPSRLNHAEQSNTSIIYGDRAIFKLYRRLQPGINPDLEMTHYLTVRRGLDCIAHLLGSMHYHLDEGTAFDAGMLQNFVADGADGWSAMQATVLAWLRAGGDLPRLPGVAAATELGRTLLLVHQALAGPHRDEPDFVAQPATPGQALAWLKAARRQAEQTIQALAAHRELLAPADRAAAEALLTRLNYSDGDAADAASCLVSEPGDWHDMGVSMRLHGDLHLGQVLQRPDGTFVIVDFEGEPLLPLAQRRRLHSPVRDVAGMLRSFAYAASAVCFAQPTYQLAAHLWQQAVCDAFVAAYTDGSRPLAVALLPRQNANRQGLLRMFCQQKALYELHYELMHRPSWAGIPLSAVHRALDAGAV